MPFTLMRYKDGKEMPIKVSILDAFRSAPPRRPKVAKPVQMKVKEVKEVKEAKKVRGGFLFSSKNYYSDSY
jgi:hypothetical protein